MATLTASHPVPAHQLRDEVKSEDTQTTKASDQHPIPRGSVQTFLSFYQEPADGSVPFRYVETPPEGQPQENYRTINQAVTLSDIRDQEDNFDLDRNAFAAWKSVPSSMTYADWENDDAIKQTYYPEVEKLLLDRISGAHKIVIFDHTIRRNREGSTRTPVFRVHIDQTRAAAAERVRLHASSSEDAEELLKGRYRIINVWRPLNGPIYKHPLAVSDSSSVADPDLIPVEHRYPNRTGYTAGVRYNEGQKWWYWSGMTDDERLLLKCSDSDSVHGKVGRVPHTAFVDPRSPEGAPERESIEVRTLVFG